MAIPILLLLLGCIVHSSHGSVASMERQDLSPTTYPLAMCNDGTQANYFHQPGQHKGKIKINLEGGGKCDSIVACQYRCNHTEFHCTAKTEWDTVEDTKDAIFPDYWNVFVHYCSSDLWSGTREASDQTGGFFFYGKNIFEAVVQDLAENYDLLSATNIVLMGGSAGAQGVTFRCDDFSEWVWSQNPDIDILCVPDAPEYYPPDVFTEGCASREPGYQNHLTEFYGRVEDKSCLEHAAQAGVENVGELCGVTANFIGFITTPLILLTSHEDRIFTGAFGCEPELGTPEHDQFRQEWMAGHSELLMELEVEFPHISFMACNCRTHGFGSNQKITVTIEETGETVNAATFIDEVVKGGVPLHANDDVTVENPSCQLN